MLSFLTDFLLLVILHLLKLGHPARLTGKEERQMARLRRKGAPPGHSPVLQAPALPLAAKVGAERTWANQARY